MTSAILIAVAILSAGCASVGNEALRAASEASVASKIIEGKTTKSEIRTMFGSPIKTSFTDGGLEIWNFEFSNVALDPIGYVPVINWFGSTSSGKKKELVVLFDQDSKVRRFSMSESDLRVKSGVFNQ